MGKMRKPFQGVLNILRFNWHFYVLSIGFLLLFFVLSITYESLYGYLWMVYIAILWVNIISLSVSYYVYDLSALYDFNWLDMQGTEGKIINISAGFDETSAILRKKFMAAELIVLDFYDPSRHTEVSIKRARKAYPVFPGTQSVESVNLQLEKNSADKIFVILSAHEIRDKDERIKFFKELKRLLKPTGQIFIVEHLRDTANFLAYSIGFFHFYSKPIWCEVFQAAELKIQNEIKITPFISTFILEKNGSTF
ncbi:class I SAM-dependent methyltransferase [Pedobacter hiemivivus]|uniref:Class I SAM-dependent methyltransferase n=2 Tax=Pedobacter hiemivivus TaxID=2530454 RepID=A0A4U1G0P7_9SPHI|nr:class I SAM-dependent methyltransferase [Pedobacter hiemivivus]